jgi:hypothetical protein
VYKPSLLFDRTEQERKDPFLFWKRDDKRYPGWDCERIVVTDDLETFSRQNNHRQPWQFAYLPWERAYKYIQQFPAAPPAE